MQGRFKRDGSASAKPEPHGATGPDKGSSSPQHAQNPGSAPAGDRGERAGRSGTSGAASAPSAATATPTVKPATGQGVVGPGSRLALRNWRISTRLVSLLALPVVAATTLGALRINENLDDIQQLDHMKLLTDMTKQATELAAALQEERDQSAGPLSHPSSASAITVKSYQEKTDRAKQNFIDASEEIDAASKDGGLQGVRDTLVGLAGELNELGKIRKAAYDDEGNSARTIEAYHRLITELLDLSQDMAEATSNPEMIQRTRALAAFSSAKEYASIQRAVIAAALPANNTSAGHLSVNDRLYGQSALDGETSELNSFRTIYGSGVDELLRPIEEGNPTIQAANVYAKRALDSDSGLSQQDKRSYRDWVDDSSTKIEQMKKIEHTLLEEMEQKARELRTATERDAIISGALVLLVLGVSLVGAFVVARSMIRSLRRLQDTATKVAQERLPELVKQLSEADPQDVDTSVESVGVHSRDEIGQVAAAFDEVHREAVRLAAEQAMLRGNVNAMFTNLSRRSQGLIQRQLSLISELESREADPDQLASLFKLDHLATRMRRNGENLLVLAGEEPGRRWTRPVPLVDVLRAAASEVEQYERIELSSVPTTEVAGRVVNDLVHLLAELLENATSFSSPQTKVKVTGHALPDGRVLIEIHDTGIGLSPEDLAAINERLASPPTVDVSVSRRMGLFVVGRLSQRHGIRIQLRPSDSGGTTALVMLPVDVAQGGRKPAPGKGGGPSGAPAAAAAAAGAAAARRQAQQSGQAGRFGGPGGSGNSAGSRGQVGAGQGPRAALPGTSGRPGGGPGGPGAARGPQGPGQPQQGRAFPADAGTGNRAPGGAQDLQTAAPGGAAHSFGGRSDAGRPDGARQDVFGSARSGASAQRTGGAERSRAPQLPSRGGPRAELPGGAPQSRTPSWGSTEAGGPAAPDTPRGHDEAPQAQTSPMPRIDDRQGPGATAEMPALPSGGGQRGPADTAAPARPGPGAGQHTGTFVRSDVFGPPRPDGGRGPARQPAADPFTSGPSQGAGATGQYPAVRRDASAADGHALAGRQDPAATGGFPRPQPADPAGARRQEPEALPPAPGGSDLGTPLYDTLETDWFGGGRQRTQEPEQRPAPQRTGTTPWRSSPNDDLVRQAERVRQPASGGVTTSGLPRRVPRANLVPGTAQQQQHQSGPQVSRAPDDVRGRLTNLRRGIAQGRRAGSGQTGTFPSPTHQQERQ
ncbi:MULTISPECIES: nitrate- and nitrite sensing domain-containing protein [Streptomyces]|uniref:histidine kinase n=1 Tax=Streptomyces thermoviolaceus subsp. thermoviolaceus TaxID=66860 RepID=A0ABX0YSR1_STRTL|nr:MULTISPECIES: nitrate- and nitrite sensing domain-containing protein [Streptomyces]WTD47287.1 nitrate- and nitrite sensing domain-containing protein [Streptomyces thermoviolaceus]NJP14194.1 HAMP domain-containing protein [Streptomyces thermoviolaceus subsp. thermoviolaceus]RSS08677.1 HAMP domain-containing protein [Streptomyces sp. WAC00469]GGV79594.1 histidine kinase [Streptomyces thermoviolaceus subsp. apingens]GHA91750.1 histidine kinase [Streptomyces thermoviolaceus subsp. thermoviolace